MENDSVDIPHEAYENIEQQREAAGLGMWLFLCTEIMFFGAVFLAYCEYRYLYPRSFAAASLKLNLTLGTINTVVLLGSSLSVALAVRAANMRRDGTVRFLILVTIVLGLAFLSIKGLEYYSDYQEGLVPGASFTYSATQPNVQPREVEMFFVLYFIMTSVHAVHMIIGISAFGVLIVLSYRNRLSVQTIENTGLYWHFVDVIWIFLFPLLYLVSHR